jgi:hypothetical protein
MNTSTWTPWAEDIVAENWKGLADHLHINRSIRNFESKQAEGSSPCDVGDSGASHLTGIHNRIHSHIFHNSSTRGKSVHGKLETARDGYGGKVEGDGRIREEVMQRLLIKKDGVDDSNSTAVTLSRRSRTRSNIRRGTEAPDGSL